MVAKEMHGTGHSVPILGVHRCLTESNSDGELMAERELTIAWGKETAREKALG